MDFSQIYSQALPILKEIAIYVVIPAIAALIKSERLALDNSTQANGIVHWYRLAKKALAVMPPNAINALEAKIEGDVPELSPIVQAIDPNESAGTPPA